MARIRSIKPVFFRHELLQDLEISHASLRPMLVFAALWGHCDRQGMFEWRPRQLKLDILPFLPFELIDTLVLLQDNDLVKRFTVDGKDFGWIPTFNDHQRITGKEAQEPARFPAHPDSIPKATPGKQSRINRASPGSTRKGREGKGKDKETLGQRADRFNDFWAVYPSRPGTSKGKKKDSEAKWRAKKLDTVADVIIEDVLLRIRKDKQWLDGFSPDPLTYINGERWSDGFSALQPAAQPAPGASPRKPETPQSHIDAVEVWAARMRELGAVPEQEIQDQVDRVKARYGGST